MLCLILCVISIDDCYKNYDCCLLESRIDLHNVLHNVLRTVLHTNLHTDLKDIYIIPDIRNAIWNIINLHTIALVSKGLSNCVERLKFTY